MADQLAGAHRRIAEAEHGIEKRMKALAPKVPDPEGTETAADEISRRADEHVATADRIDRPRSD